MLPPSVAKLRMSGEATLSAAWLRMGQFFLMSGESTRAVSVVAAPTVSALPATLMPTISGIVVTSISFSG